METGRDKDLTKTLAGQATGLEEEVGRPSACSLCLTLVECSGLVFISGGREV
jgi:hypothetical protein